MISPTVKKSENLERKQHPANTEAIAGNDIRWVVHLQHNPAQTYTQ